MNTQDAMKIAEEHLASYLRLATSHEGKSLEDDEEALMWHDKADAIADLMDDWKRREKAETDPLIAFLQDMEKIYRCAGWADNEVHFSLQDLRQNISNYGGTEDETDRR